MGNSSDRVKYIAEKLRDFYSGNNFSFIYTYEKQEIIRKAYEKQYLIEHTELGELLYGKEST